MRIDEILKQYQQEWLLIKVTKWDDQWEPLDGEVMFHSPLADDVLKEMAHLKDNSVDFAVRFAGEFPEDLAVLL